MPATTFVNDRRPLSKEYEGFGEYRTCWTTYEVKCSCGRWFSEYGDVSEQVGDDPSVQSWLCSKCVAISNAEFAKQGV